MMDRRITSPLHDPLPILIIANQANWLLQCPHLRVALPGASASGPEDEATFLPRLWLPFSSPQPTATLFLHKILKLHFQKHAKNFICETGANNLKNGKINLYCHRCNQHFTHPYFSPYTPPGSPSQLLKPWTPPQLGGASLGGAAFHLRLHQGSNTLPGQITEAKISYTVHDTGCIRLASGNKDES